MRISYCSDLHLEFGSIEIHNDNNSDLLLLCGDIIIGKNLHNKEISFSNNKEIHKFFQQISNEFSDIIYILGNHEYYKGIFEDTLPNIKRHLSYLTNVHVLQNENIVINDINFICGTMWTNLNKNDPLAFLDAKNFMNDYYVISVENCMGRQRRFRPEDSYQEHNNFMEFAKNAIKKDKENIFVTHHCPVLDCIPKKYQKDILSPCYASDLSDFIIENNIKYWFCGHTHNVGGFLDGVVRMNCRGYYGIEVLSDLFEMRSIDVSISNEKRT